jgi:hypothetical protein
MTPVLPFRADDHLFYDSLLAECPNHPAARQSYWISAGNRNLNHCLNPWRPGHNYRADSFHGPGSVSLRENYIVVNGVLAETTFCKAISRGESFAMANKSGIPVSIRLLSPAQVGQYNRPEALVIGRGVTSNTFKKRPHNGGKIS